MRIDRGRHHQIAIRRLDVADQIRDVDRHDPAVFRPRRRPVHSRRRFVDVGHRHRDIPRDGLATRARLDGHVVDVVAAGGVLTLQIGPDEGQEAVGGNRKQRRVVTRERVGHGRTVAIHREILANGKALVLGDARREGPLREARREEVVGRDGLVVGEGQGLDIGDHVGAVDAGDDDVRPVAGDRVVRPVAREDHRVGARAAVDLVVALSGEDPVVAGAGEDQVASGAGRGVRPGVGRCVTGAFEVDVVIARAAIDDVVVGAAGDVVVAAAAIDYVVAGLPVDLLAEIVGGLGAAIHAEGDEVVIAGTDDDLVGTVDGDGDGAGAGTDAGSVDEFHRIGGGDALALVEELDEIVGKGKARCDGAIGRAAVVAGDRGLESRLESCLQRLGQGGFRVHARRIADHRRRDAVGAVADRDRVVVGEVHIREGDRVAGGEIAGGDGRILGE